MPSVWSLDDSTGLWVQSKADLEVEGPARLQLLTLLVRGRRGSSFSLLSPTFKEYNSTSPHDAFASDIIIKREEG